ncbi:hypothetical protein PtrSN002B_004301 [Pyrenophora tritici-repentis]|uniref:Herpes-BLLF1 multi-domain protein n=2 Tax=Pyrenophora tritici-repentis TaxID=45151 RepID=A0A2W1D5U8_9PLEO|nr:uncharacterized protein PTRG_03816 [Pyrenophora tritici-repentis Pt-1C-BFP]KAA8620130.1 hypothetical protein PtrV1_07224 [Pyrenophora tritici-repentis]EDU46654.1 hypothetical protein PTRG_03816 [Pyrenophora tritici-repentis Pt-1C-BFP]KAF7448280.1 hypothetical protein A1F99_076440 [Pyrenophora tritici-repentis]KAF7571998.1 Herpes-BLLF1 multi-domain protein [Pyrenophora tritici-repentis]KAG9384818.1 hypothetical protein A1F94_004365 [Pyrenophora tritici-repentis]
MLQSTIFITLLAGSVVAAPLAEGSVKTTSSCTSLTASPTPIDEGYGPTQVASQPVHSAPTIASMTPSVTIAPPVPSAPIPADDDQPAIFVSYTFSWSSDWDAKTFTERYFPSTLPTPSSLMPVTTPAIMPTGAPEVPTTPLPIETTCTEEEAQKTRTPLDTTTSSASPSTMPTDADSTFSSPSPTGNSTRPTAPLRPSSTGSPDEHKGDGYGYGRPRPSDKWPFKHQPSGGLHHPTGGLYHPKQPSPSSTTCTGEAKASSTMQTSVRPTLTAGGY